MIRHRPFLPLLFLLVATPACTASRVVTDDVTPLQLAAAFEGEHAFLHLHDGSVTKAVSLVIGAEALWYTTGRNDATSHSVPLWEVGYIEVTRPRKPQRVQANLVGGTAAGLAVGTGAYLLAKSDLENEACESENCIGVAFGLFLSRLLVPTGVLLGITAGGIANLGRPRDRYYVQYRLGGGTEVTFLKEER